ncbi:uncharacterized protein C19orf44 homolog [Osmerus mordax]|uniref:uncharacterized protein C19orf44 homolog n=1 Tax=Osmerus mordax TaxID=8014 RepID=UPI00350EC9A2
MWNRGARSSALERAQAQLSGRRLVNTVPEPWEAKRSTSSLDGVAKTALQTRQTSFQDLSDLSSEGTVSHDIIRPTAARRLGKQEHSSPPPPAPESSGAGAGGGGSRFLKKAPPAMASSLSPALSKTQTQPLEPRYVASSQRSSQSTALSRLALIEDRIRNRQQARDGPPSSAPNRGSTPGPAAQETPLSLSAQSSSDLSMKGKRFLKTKTPTTTATTLATAANAPTVAPKGSEASFKAATPLGGSKASPVANRGVTLDSDEEDMRQLLGGSFESPEDSLLTGLRGASQNIPRKSFRKGTPKISPSPPSVGRASSARRLSRSPPSSLRGSPNRFGFSSRPQAPPSPSLSAHSPVLSPLPQSPEGPFPGRTGSLRSRPLRRSLSSPLDRSDVRSLEELFPEALGSLEELHPEALGSLAELYPEALDSDDAISEHSGVSDDFKIKVMSLDDLAPVTLGDTGRPAKKKTESKHRAVVSPRPLEEEPSEEAQEEAQELALSYESDFESEVRTEEGASDISEHLGDEKEETSEGAKFKQRRAADSDRSHGRYSDSLSERSRRSRSQSRSYDGQDSRADGKSRSDSTISRASRSLSRSDSSSRTVTPPRRSKTRPSGPAVRETASQTQPDGLTYAWSSVFASLGPAVGMAYVDPTPVASHTISAEAVEALSAYSPAVFALNDMLRQQLSLTRHFVQANRYLHSSLLQTLEPADYTYTTLEGTKEFIRCHKPPRLTMEDALEEVLQEMRDYHYI